MCRAPRLSCKHRRQCQAEGLPFAFVFCLLGSVAAIPSRLNPFGLIRREGGGLSASLLSAGSGGADGAAGRSAVDGEGFSLAGACCGEEGRHLPDTLEEMSRIWHGKMKLDEEHPHFGQRLRDDLKIVLGILSLGPQSEAREITRQTWMRQPGVCLAVHGPQPDCSIYVVFVVGNKTLGKLQNHSDSRREDVMLVDDDIPSVVKNRQWLQTAVEKYPWATHVGKIDQDTFPHLRQMLPRVPPLNMTCAVYFGASIPSHGCGLLEITEASVNEQTKYACMHGSLFLMSQKLTSDLNKSGFLDEWLNPKHNEIDGEDLNLGIAVTSYVRKTNICLNIADAWVSDDPGGAWDHCGVKCGGIIGHGTFR